WLRNKRSRQVRDYLKAENAYTAAMMAPSRPLQKALYREMLRRIKETDVDVPYREHGWYYYSRTQKGKQYRIFCRRQGSMEAPEMVILDANLEARSHKYFSLGLLEVSPDGNLLAYSTDVTGFREYTLAFKDLRTGKILPGRIPKVRSAAWSLDNRTLFYVVEDDAKRAYRVYRHRLGETKDALVYEETDARFSVSVSMCRSEQWILLTSHSATTSEVRCVRAAEPYASPRLLASTRQ